MVRQKMKCQGKFFLFNERIRQYFHAMGVEDSGDGPEAYLHWSPYFAGAMGFDTIKAARSSYGLGGMEVPPDSFLSLQAGCITGKGSWSWFFVDISLFCFDILITLKNG